MAWDGRHEPLALPSTARHAVIPRQAAAPQPDLFPQKALAQFALQQPLEDVETHSHQEAFRNALATFMLLDIATHQLFVSVLYITFQGSTETITPSVHQ